MGFRTTIITLLFLASFVNILLAQSCIEYPDIEGAICEGCSPSGWDQAFPSPGIVDSDGNWPGVGCIIQVDGESPGGGNMALMGGVSGFFEAIETTVSGLDPDQEYAFGLYWHYSIDCQGVIVFEPAELVVTVDGTEYTFNGSEQWELIEFCFMPSSSSIEILISGDVNGPEAGVVLVDTAPCEDLTPCCSLIVTAEEEYEICPGQSLLLDADYSDEEGGVTILWESDPPDGVDFLSDTDVIAPTFEYPEDENFEGQTYVFTLTVEDDLCIRIREVVVTVLSTEVPTFDINICELSFVDMFPLVSENGYTGIWDGDFDFEDLVGTTQEYVFTLDTGQENCILEYTYNIPINPATELTFLYDNSYCVLDDSNYELPDDSEENVEGEWLEGSFSPYELGVGVFTYNFQPDEEYCAFPFEVEIEIFEESFLTFEIPDTFCVSSENYTLPLSSLEGIVGNWEYPEIDLYSAQSEEEIIFVPEDVNDCFGNYEHIYTVLEDITATFDIPDTLCRSSGPIVFDGMSIEGNLGTWLPSFVNPDSISGNSFTIEWTPLNGLTSCSATTIMTIEIIDEIDLLFDLPLSLCKSSDLILLPMSDISGTVMGTWNLTSLDPQTIDSSFVDLIFTPNNTNCASSVNVPIEIVNPTIPEFSFNTEFCVSDAVFVLPEISDNNIFGTWTITEVDPVNVIDSIESIFIPVGDCVEALTVSFYVKNLITPSFNLPSLLCGDASSEFEFPTTSNNGIEGIWSTPIFDADTNVTTLFQNEFVPIDQDCYTNYFSDFEVVNTGDIEYDFLSPTSCIAEDGYINFEGNEYDIELSIDDGLTWLSDTLIFENLPEGNYDFLVRYKDISVCYLTTFFSLSGPPIPEIRDIENNDIQTCGGSEAFINCIADGNDLEYSLDRMSWQVESSFTNLEAGFYVVYVRSGSENACVDSVVVEILEFPLTKILSLNAFSPNDCTTPNGSIEVIAEGQNLEYSIDNGVAWSDNNVFENLPDGTYDVIVRSKDDLDCISTETQVLSIPQIPAIDDVLVSPISDCESSDGGATVLATGPDLEFSLDQVNWQLINAFPNLSPGSYTVYVRNSNFSNCIGEFNFLLMNPDCPCSDIEVFYDMIPSSCSDANSGSIRITNITGTNFMNPEIIWSNGVEGDVNANIPEGEYIFTVNYESDCTFTDTVQLTSIPLLNYNIQITDVDCFEKGIIEILNVTGGTNLFQFSIDGVNFQDQPVFENLDGGTYTVIVRDVTGCEKSEEATVLENLSSQTEIIELTSISIGESLLLDSGIDLLEVDSIFWFLNDIPYDSENPSIEVVVTENLKYRVVFYKNNCSQEVVFEISVEESEGIINVDDVYLGNVFTPNGDGNNDAFFIQSTMNANVEILTFLIYDRWGNLVFEKPNPEVNNSSDGWNGFYNNTEALAGVYSYVVKYKANQENKFVLGQLTLIR